MAEEIAAKMHSPKTQTRLSFLLWLCAHFADIFFEHDMHIILHAPHSMHKISAKLYFYMRNKFFIFVLTHNFRANSIV